ncbi:DNA polymerase III subunit delta [Ignavibacteria bacterium CHB1]|nr:MAG: DNA polymerase III subunit delta [Chlorobiota bacterium]MBV6398180.1 hypothetical protein [Ignavibacteria bacterium]MCC6885908.1 DNA polymerase III subunit delta [Ignavibacteriales bacterium]MCE7953435.1 DNA polymerase III subunit delta [Chlorobi bacterium CHB7]MDL1887371.1 DNA polymerase III subunit delta [Ignavibacteria bacterium CHB1]RIK48696.1 MAG: DNA polymerase III subunit delta [Ignavibacteriota bacterium]
MSKSKTVNIAFNILKKKLSTDKLAPCIIINSTQKPLIEELIAVIGKSFIGNYFNFTEHVKTFFTDDKNSEAVLSECANASFFIEKKIVLLKVVKKPGYRGFTKQENESFSNYIRTANPDNILLIADYSDEFKVAQYADLEKAGAEIFSIKQFNETEFANWVRDNFTSYEIGDDELNYFCSFLNLSVDQAREEIEKLKIYCSNRKKITLDDIKVCIGISKDYSEFDFINAVLNKNADRALNVFRSISNKKDFATYSAYLLSSAYIAISKLKDPGISKLNPYQLRVELKIWNDFEKLCSLYKKKASELNELKLKNAFDYIYSVELKLKSSESNKDLLISKLIIDLVNL